MKNFEINEMDINFTNIFLEIFLKKVKEYGLKGFFIYICKVPIVDFH